MSSAPPHDGSALAGIAGDTTEWQRARELQSRAAGAGFDWPDPGNAMRRANAKFERRFRLMEALAAAAGEALSALPLARQEQYWQLAKAHEFALASTGPDRQRQR